VSDPLIARMRSIEQAECCSCGHKDAGEERIGSGLRYKENAGDDTYSVVAMSAFFMTTPFSFWSCVASKMSQKPFNPLDLIDLIEKALPE